MSQQQRILATIAATQREHGEHLDADDLAIQIFNELERVGYRIIEKSPNQNQSS